MGTNGPFAVREVESAALPDDAVKFSASPTLFSGIEPGLLDPPIARICALVLRMFPE